MLDHL